ncbi:MAG TPA: dihydroorotate dehydrogenase electron transfer subunit [Myxococcota bacterium]
MTAALPLAIRVDAVVRSNRPEGAGAGPAPGASRRLVLEVPGWPGSTPGQFAMLSPGARGAAVRFDPLLPRPMAVYRATPEPGGAAVEVLYKVSGRGTALLADARPGERVRIVGPLGVGFPLPAPGQRALLVGGGTGIASLHDLAAAARARGPTVVLLGARSAGDLMGRDDLAALGVELRVATEDGSAGHRGLVTELLERALAEPGAGGELVYACGPTAMMRRVAALAAAAGRRCIVSLENRMACGFGVCLGCAVPRAGGGFALVCRDGPVLEASALDWEGVP